MESGSYLHKKFKNKVNVEPSSNPIQNEKENNSSLRANVSSTESSIFGNLYSKPNYVNKPTIEEETTSPSQLPPPQPPPPQVIRIEPQDYQIKDEGAKPPEDIQPPPDRNPNGKYVCNYCNLVCSKPSVLQKHIRAHTNERPYPCNSCGFSFKTRSNLYKHCRSRTHANRVMGKAQEMNSDMEVQKSSPPKSPPNSGSNLGERTGQDMRMKPYKPRFHTRFDNVAKENMEVDEDVQQEVPVNHRNHHPSSDILSHHINEIINKNNSIVNSVEFAHRYRCDSYYSPNIIEQRAASDEPLNLTTKNRKRCLSEVAEPVGPKSLIKELLLKNLYSDMQCHYCKMIFQTVTELELHKLRSCKGKPSGAKYTRSSSVNVASILTQNKNAFDNIPYLHNTVFPLNSPGPFLGKTRLVDSDKSKSFSFDDGLRSANLPALISPNELPTTPSILLSPLSFEKEKKAAIKLFGGEVKITHTTGETKSFKIGQKEGEKFEGDGSFQENRLVKSTLQSGGTVQINKTNYSKDQRVITRVYDSTVSPSPSIDIASFAKTKFSFEVEPPMIDNHLTSVLITTTAPTTIIVETPPKEKPQPLELKTPPLKSPINNHVNNHNSTSSSPTVTTSAPTPKKFPRPNSLALKPTTASLKQHHGLTPTRFNQILISPDTPRVAKKFAQHILHGNYFSYLGLKSSTRPVYCTLNKTQPFYVPHFKKLSMYSEWRQQDTKTDKLSVSAYDSRQKSGRFTQAGKAVANLITQSNYKLFVSELASSKIEKDEDQNKGPVPGGYESNEDYTYIRGRGKSRKWRGRYVCEQCGIRCKKPSMLKKHIRTHSNDRAYTCNHCNFSFKTKGNLTKHMKSKAHTKNYAASSSSSGSSTQQSGTQSSSDSDTEDSGMDSSDECIRQQEHDAAYGLLSLSQKTTQTVATNAQSDSLATSHTLAKSVATEYLKLATKNECYPDGSRDNSNFSPHGNKEVNDLIVKPEGNKSCTICAKSFSKPSQLRLHMNIHYLERPFRCDSCSVSFRTKGHLQKHERSASHHNKLSSPALSSSEPRPFKCTDCNIAFRIHGHLAKHLRSKMHIMKLECLAKIPFGLFAELERSNSLLTEINTCDGDQCLESLRTLAKKVFINDPNKLNILEADS